MGLERVGSPPGHRGELFFLMGEERTDCNRPEVTSAGQRVVLVSHATLVGDVEMVYSRLFVIMREPRALGCMPSRAKKAGRFQKRLKLSIKARLRVAQVSCNQVCRLRVRLKRSMPRLKGGRGPEMKKRLPWVAAMESKSALNSALSLSEPWVGILLQPTCNTTSWASGCCAKMLGICFMMSATLAPGKWNVATDLFLMFLAIESPIKSVVGGGGSNGGGIVTRGAVGTGGRIERGAGSLRGAGVKHSVAGRVRERGGH